MSTFMEEYKQKLITPDQAAKLVKSGDYVNYAEFSSFPAEFDKALGKRAEEEGLLDVTIDAAGSVRFPEVVKNDPEMKTFTYYSAHYSGIDRMLGDKNRISYYITQYHDLQKIRGEAVQPWTKKNLSCVLTAPMDSHGNFNFGMTTSDTYAQLKNSEIVIVEVNEKIPYVMGGYMESINIKDVDYIIESDESVFLMPDSTKISPASQKIAENIMPLIEDRSVLQLGIGGVPNAIGAMIAGSGLKDLGIQTEMFCDAMTAMYEAGKITNKYKRRDVGRSIFTFCFGNKKTHEFLHKNPQVAGYNCDYTNNPKNIAIEDKVVSINNIIEVDLFSQVNSESDGIRHISGTGGSLDYHIGAWESNGGKGIFAFESTYTDKEGKVHSRVRPTLSPGSIVTCPRTLVHYLATEHGIVNIKGRTIWGRAEAVISIAHPDFRDELIKQAQAMKIWSPTNKIAY